MKDKERVRELHQLPYTEMVKLTLLDSSLYCKFTKKKKFSGREHQQVVTLT